MKPGLLPVSSLLLVLAGVVQPAAARDHPFILGTDISWASEDEAACGPVEDAGWGVGGREN
jgi:hypothetical protein